MADKQNKKEKYEGFSVGMALMDAVPVLVFGISCLLIGFSFGSPLFIIGASLCFLGGVCKVLWKLLVGLKQKDVVWMNKQFRFTMSGGFLLIILAVLLNLGRIDWAGLGATVLSFPAILFFGLWLAGMVGMGVLAKKLDSTEARSNWIEQSVNCLAQLCLLAGILCCVC